MLHPHAIFRERILTGAVVALDRAEIAVGDALQFGTVHPLGRRDRREPRGIGPARGVEPRGPVGIGGDAAHQPRPNDNRLDLGERVARHLHPRGDDRTRGPFDDRREGHDGAGGGIDEIVAIGADRIGGAP